MCNEEGVEVQAKGTHNLFNQKAKTFSNIQKKMPIHVQEVSRTPKRCDQNIPLQGILSLKQLA
jgi:hypothetical protein